MLNEKKIEAIKKGKAITVFDIMFMTAVLVIALLLIFLVVYNKEGAYLAIRYNGTENIYSLSKDDTIDVGGHLTVKIENGYAYVFKSDCNNQDCIYLGGRVKYVGQKIVCLPNKVVLEIVSSYEVDPEWAIT